MPDLTTPQFIGAAILIIIVVATLGMCYATLWLDPQDHVEQPEVERE